MSWFLLDYDGEISEPLQQDLSEDIDLCEWVPIDDLLDKLDAGRPYLRSVRNTVSESLHLLRQAALGERVGYAVS